MADPSVQPTDTLFLGNLHFSVDRDILYEIGIQAGPVTKVVVPMDPATNRSKGFGFIHYETVESATYAASLFSGNLVLHGKEVRVAFSPRGNTE